MLHHIVTYVELEKSLTLDLAKEIALALVSSKVDYCKSIFHNRPMQGKDIARLQRLSQSVPILKRLHWLPVKFRIHFKIFTITFQTLKDNQLAYLADLFGRNSQNIWSSLMERPSR